MDINGKIAVITGGTGGIGQAITKQMLKNGIKLIAVFDLDNANSRTVITRLKKDYGERVELYTCDVSNKESFTENFEKVLKKHKIIDILINNAGITGDNRTELMIDLNYKAVILGCLLFIDRLGKHKGGNGGVIVNTASILGLMNVNFMPLYCSTKHALVSFTRCLDMKQYDVTGVRVVAICPGQTDTPIVSDIIHSFDFINDAGKSFFKATAQSPIVVAEAVVKIIQKGKSGDIWVSENGQPPYAVKDLGNCPNSRISIEK